MTQPTIPSPITLVQLTQLYDDLVDSINNNKIAESIETVDDIPSNTLATICDILLATQQLSDEQCCAVQRTRDIVSMQQCGETRIEIRILEPAEFLFEWTVKAETININLAADQLEEEESELLAMANTPIP